MRYTIVQKDLLPPTAEQLRRAFKALPRFTDADAVRLAHEAYGLLVKDLSSDEAPVLQRALQTEGIATAVVGEGGLPRLPEAKFVKKLEMLPESLVVYDPLGRPIAVPWPHLFLIAAGAVRHFDVSTTRTEERVASFSPLRGLHAKTVEDVRHRVDRDVKHLLDIFLTGAAVRFQIEAENFLFKYVFDRPELAVGHKLGYLVQLLAQRAPEAHLNRGASGLRDHHAKQHLVFASKSAFFDESVWWLWRLQQRHADKEPGGGTGPPAPPGPSPG